MSATNAAVKNFAEIPSDKKTNNIVFTPEEWEYLMKEVNKQIEEKGAVDFQRAINNARYLAKLERGAKQLAEGRGHFHELIEVE